MNITATHIWIHRKGNLTLESSKNSTKTHHIANMRLGQLPFNRGLLQCNMQLKQHKVPIIDRLLANPSTL